METRGLGEKKASVAFLSKDALGLWLVPRASFPLKNAAPISEFFAVAEIVLTMQYALVFYLLIDHPKMKLVEAFRVSRERMRGNKGRLFYICLSFLGWGVLAALSFGIGYLWIGPYMIQTQVGFYLDVVGEPVQREPE